MLSITFVPGGRVRVALGEIVIGSHAERFESPLEYWSRARYRAQWLEGARQLSSGASASCWITGITNPKSANFITWWPMWRIENRIIIQQHLLFMDRISFRFSENDPYLHLPSRSTKTDDGEPISEWSASIEDLNMCVEKLEA